MRRALWIVTALALVTSSACKRRQAPPVEEVWDEPASEGDTEAVSALAPAWPRPTRATLDNGLIVHWLDEAETPALHARLMIPIAARTSSAAVTIVAEMFRAEVERRGRRFGIDVEVSHGPGRVELTAHGLDANAEATLALISNVLGAEPSSSQIERARRRVIARRSPPTADDIAISVLVSRLTGSREPPIEVKAVRALSRSSLEAAWSELTDPRRMVMIVHARRKAAALRGPLRDLADRWRGSDRREVKTSAIARLRPPTTPSDRARHRLLSEPAAPLRAVPAPGKPVLLIGRVIPTKTAKHRSVARLAQRLMQEEVDVRLVVMGSRALLVIRLALAGKRPEMQLANAVAKLSELAKQRHQSQRVFQAAQLWLGARLVQASIDGEDWTRLWAESIDLSVDDKAIHRAIGKDTRSMLELGPDALQKWQQAWLDPRAGEGGWAWVLAGGTTRTWERLRRLTPVQVDGS